MRQIFKTQLRLLLIVFAIFQFSLTTFAQVDSCSAIFENSAEMILSARGQKLPERSDTARALANFASEHSLPAKWIEVGPPERRVKRLFVAINIDDPKLLQDYLNAFNLDQRLSDKSAGTLVLEFNKEAVAGQYYVSGVLRISNNPDEPIYRWGRRDLPYKNWLGNWLRGYSKEDEHQNTGILGLAHLIELNEDEQNNVKLYLQHSNVDLADPVVGKCKSTNCVAWTSGIELGSTKIGASDEERKYLFTELGVARAMAHFEIGRRLVHAASDRHSAIAVFVSGEKGLDTFQSSLEKYLVPEPKIPYASIIKNIIIQSPAQDAIKVINDGDKIFFPIAAGASPDSMAALIEHAKTLKKGIDVHVLVNGISENDFKKGVETTDGRFRVHALFLGSNLRSLYQEKKVSVIPGNLSDFTRLMQDSNKTDFHYDAIVVRVSPPDQDGRYSLGPNNDMIMTIIRNRPGIKIIAEINPNVPFTTGNNFLREDQFASKFESKSDLAGPAAVPPNDIDAAIGMHLGSLIDSGATLQIGIGNIFSGVPNGLLQANKKNIKISTEMFGDPMMQMIENGTATIAETGFAYGSKALYRWLHLNKKVLFKETEFINSPGRVARTKNFHAVNTALQVNLNGEVNATMGPNGRISSPGGQVEFMSGAARSSGGKAIIAIRSTAKNGEISSIVIDLYKGPITTPHESVTHIVTEFGIAELAGKNETQRAINLIKIAHPKFRNDLTEKAIERNILSRDEAMKAGLL